MKSFFGVRRSSGTGEDSQGTSGATESGNFLDVPTSSQNSPKKGRRLSAGGAFSFNPNNSNDLRRTSGDSGGSKDISLKKRFRNAFTRSNSADPPPREIISVEEFPDLPLRFDPALPDENALLTLDLANELRSKMLSKYRFNNIWGLLYKLSSNGASFQTMWDRVCRQGPTIWLFRGTNAPGLLVGAFVADSIRRPGWSLKDEYYYGTGEGFMFEVVRGSGQLRVCETTLKNSHYLATLPDAILWGGSGGDPYAALPISGSAAVHLGQGIALQVSSEFIAAWSEGDCPTFDLGGIPLGCARDAEGQPTGCADNGDRGLAFQFGVADVEVHGLRFGRENGASAPLIGTNTV
jgi:hypothetical protein